MSETSAAVRLQTQLDEGGARYRVIEHAPEGRTDVVSEMRGHPVGQAAKCIVVRTKVTKKTSRYVLAVVPGDRRVDLDRIRELCEARSASFADPETAERLTRSVSGSIVPFSFDPALELLVDPDLLGHSEIYFNAATLDRSLALDTQDYLRIARPTLERIAEPVDGPQG
ncbi:YbaK/EbsC family protein [Streptacidiphilus cavernicola]|uniref:YbaK/EbsC family protein n=1 Tax=Streptacidiphilus cavernicola TaxID=3342716 RepID=A0ABV6VYU4_9ACTN